MKTRVGVDVFLTSALIWCKWSPSRGFTSRERSSGNYWTGDWVGPRAGLDDVKKIKMSSLSGLELRPLGHPARSQSLYHLPSSPYEGRFVPVLNWALRHEDWWESGAMSRRFLNLGIRHMWLVSFILRPPYPRESRPHVINWLSRSHSRSGRCTKKRNDFFCI
jgi:hypothetical protein